MNEHVIRFFTGAIVIGAAGAIVFFGSAYPKALFAIVLVIACYAIGTVVTIMARKQS
jgi:hypothetical protein